MKRGFASFLFGNDNALILRILHVRQGDGAGGCKLGQAMDNQDTVPVRRLLKWNKVTFFEVAYFEVI
ncbi:hypothetical protein POVCU1_028520 [Plasmodium ovale curtisi]|uniref:Uncharacterized protein n=1 Tax=Plasmodium ovale curtisi TaxID=864141 RepID=A0A1A8WNQ7_PLAOA|nr:hypothetical protein POVCU1_028520 [Plasmodium ovale curtisi]